MRRRGGNSCCSRARSRGQQGQQPRPPAHRVGRRGQIRRQEEQARWAAQYHVLFWRQVRPAVVQPLTRLLGSRRFIEGQDPRRPRLKPERAACRGQRARCFLVRKGDLGCLLWPLRWGRGCLLCPLAKPPDGLCHLCWPEQQPRSIIGKVIVSSCGCFICTHPGRGKLVVSDRRPHTCPVAPSGCSLGWLGFPDSHSTRRTPARERQVGVHVSGCTHVCTFLSAILSPVLLQNSILYPQTDIPGTCWEERRSRLVRTARGWEQ